MHVTTPVLQFEGTLMMFTCALLLKWVVK